MGLENLQSASHIALGDLRLLPGDSLVLNLAQTDIIPPGFPSGHPPAPEEAVNTGDLLRSRVESQLNLCPVLRALYSRTARSIGVGADIK